MKSKIITVKSVDDYNKFIKKIKYYKTFLYRNTKFKIEQNKIFKDIESIEKALNLKKKKERTEYVYSYCCDYIDNYCKDKDFCKFKDNKCLNQYHNNYINGCCRGCRFQSKSGCKTSNLTCKLFYCSSVKDNNKIVEYKDLKIIRCLPLRNRPIIKHDFFVSREEMLNDLYLNSIIIFVIKTLFRLRYIKKMVNSNKTS